MTTDQAERLPVSPTWQPPTRRLAAIAVVVVVVALGIFFLFGLLDSIVIAALLAFLIEPLLRGVVNKLHAPRWLAVTVTYLLVAAVVFGAIIFLPILVIESIGQIDFSGLVQELDAWLADVSAQLAANGFLGIDLSGLSAVEDATGQAQAPSLLDPGALLSALEQAFVAAAGVVGLVVGVVSSVFFVLIIAIYLSIDSRRLLGGLPRLLDESNKSEITELGRRLNGSWGDYVRGQGIMVLVIGFTTWMVAWLIGLPGALFLGIIAGLLEVIPTFGPIIATVPAVMVALFQGSTRLDVSNFVFALIVIGAYILIQQLESNIIAPKVMGASVSLPPLVVLISITAGFQVAGILGAILAVPVTANARIVLSYLWAKIHSRPPFQNPEPMLEVGPVLEASPGRSI